MGDAVLYDAMRQGLWIAFLISWPILSVALVAGLAVGLFQALTSIQELTLTFVPKLAAIVAVFWLTMGYMSAQLVAFFQTVVAPQIAGG